MAACRSDSGSALTVVTLRDAANGEGACESTAMATERGVVPSRLLPLLPLPLRPLMTLPLPLLRREYREQSQPQAISISTNLAKTAVMERGAK